MSQPWKLLPLAAIVAVIGALLLAPGGATQPNSASAELADCPSDQGTLVIEIIDDVTDDPIEVAGARVEVSPDPVDATGARDYVDNGGDDADDTVGVIEVDNACADDGNAPAASYTATLESLPAALEDCEDVDTSDNDLAPEDGETLTLVLEVDCTDVDPTATATGTGTATATATGTAGPAATVTTSASPGTISCSGTSIVTIQVRDADGDPVPAGTAVTISTTLGSVSPSSGQTTDASGNAFVFMTAPANQGGKATVTAKSGDAQGSTDVTVNCGTTPTATTAPPPTVAPGGGGGGGGVISPPNTGNAGLASEGGAPGWAPFAGIALLVAAAIGAVSIAKVRA